MTWSGVPLCLGGILGSQTTFFQDSFRVDASKFCKEKFISCIQQRDMAWGVRSDQASYECGLEVYHLNFCGRQLGFENAIPVPFFDSIQYGTSYRLPSPSEATFWASKRILNVMTKIAHKPTTLNFECTAFFTTWWEAKWSNKYDRDIREAHVRLFGQVFFKFLPKKEELDSRKKVINEKNQLLLIGNLSCYSFSLFIWSLSMLTLFPSLCTSRQPRSHNTRAKGRKGY